MTFWAVLLVIGLVLLVIGLVGALVECGKRHAPRHPEEGRYRRGAP